MNWTVLIIPTVVIVAVLLLKRSALISSEKALQLLQQGALVVDVRNPAEYDSGHVPGAVNIPLGELGRQASQCLPDKDKVVLLHCLSGARSGIAKSRLSNLGYTNVFNLGSYGRADKIVRSAPMQ